MGRLLLCAAGACLALATWSCAADVQTVGRPDAPATTPKSLDCELPVHPQDYHVSAACREIGDVYVGDTGLTTTCDRNHMLDLVRREACRAGADAAQIVNFYGHSRSSTCIQVRARFLLCNAGAHE